MARSSTPTCLLPLVLLPACGMFAAGKSELQFERERLRGMYAGQVAERQALLARIPEPVMMKPVREPRATADSVLMKPVPRFAVPASSPGENPPVAEASPPPQEPQRPEPQQPQQPVRHIDDREPTVGTTPESRALIPLDTENRWRAAMGMGHLDLEYGGTPLKDRVRTVFLEAGVGPLASERSGAGLDVSGFVSRNDLMNELVMPAPGGARPADARAWGFDFFPHFALQPDLGLDTSLSVKVGPLLGYQRVEHQDADVTRRWFDLGARVAVEPEWTLGRHGNTRLSMFGRAAYDLGTTRFQEIYGTRSAEENAMRWQGELGAGFRLAGRSLAGELSYRYRHLETGAVTSPTLGLLEDVGFTTSAIFFGLVGRF